MRSLRSFGPAALCAAVLFALPAVAAPSAPDSPPPSTQADRLIAALEAAGQAPARALEDSKDAIAEAETGLRSFGEFLNAHKDELAKIGEEAAAQIEAWQQATEQSWSDLQRSLSKALRAWQDWIEQQQAPGEEPQIPV